MLLPVQRLLHSCLERWLGDEEVAVRALSSKRSEIWHHVIGISWSPSLGRNRVGGIRLIAVKMEVECLASKNFRVHKEYDSLKLLSRQATALEDAFCRRLDG